MRGDPNSPTSPSPNPTNDPTTDPTLRNDDEN